MKLLAITTLWAASALGLPDASAAEAASPQGVLRFSSTASIEVVKDLLSISFSTTREGVDAAGVQSQLKQALDAALTEAKKSVRPGELEVHTGSFSLSPRYTPKGIVNGWQGSAELVVSGRDLPAIGQLSGRITTLTISRVGYDLSRELRERSEAELSARAITDFRAKAADYAAQFGYAGYALREIDVATGREPMLVQGTRMRAVAMSSSVEPLPVEPGTGTISVNVSGTVQLTK